MTGLLDSSNGQNYSKEEKANRNCDQLQNPFVSSGFVSI